MGAHYLIQYNHPPSCIEIYGTQSIFDKARSGEFIAFLSHLLSAYPGQFIYLILDNGNIHHFQETQI